MFKHKRAIAFAFLGVLNPILVVADEATQEITLGQQVSSKYLTSIFGEEKPATTTTHQAEVPSAWKNVKKQLALDLNAQRFTLTPRETQKIAFDLTSPLFETTIIDTSCVNKLEIIAGGENIQQYFHGSYFIRFYKHKSSYIRQ